MGGADVPNEELRIEQRRQESRRPGGSRLSSKEAAQSLNSSIPQFFKATINSSIFSILNSQFLIPNSRFAPVRIPPTLPRAR
jgi:hypothetical protein